MKELKVSIYVALISLATTLLVAPYFFGDPLGWIPVK